MSGAKLTTIDIQLVVYTTGVDVCVTFSDLHKPPIAAALDEVLGPAIEVVQLKLGEEVEKLRIAEDTAAIVAHHAAAEAAA